MRIQSLLFVLLSFTSLFLACKPQESKCVFIKIDSRKITITDLDSSCRYASKLNNDSIMLFVSINDSLSTDLVNGFYHFSKFKSNSVDKFIVLFIDNKLNFTLRRSDNMIEDSLSFKRYQFGRFVYDQLKSKATNIQLVPIYKKFDDLFLDSPG